jgi:hypothetical protein
MSSISALRILVWCPTLIGSNLPLTTLIGVTEKEKQLITYAQEATRENLERLRSIRLINGDQHITTRHAMALSKVKRLISLLAPIKQY